MKKLTALLLAATFSVTALEAHSATTTITFEDYEIGESPVIPGFSYFSGRVVADPLGDGKVLQLDSFGNNRFRHSNYWVQGLGGPRVTPPDYLALCDTVYGGCYADYINHYVKGTTLVRQDSLVIDPGFPEQGPGGAWISPEGVGITAFHGSRNLRLYGRETYLDNLVFDFDLEYRYVPEPATWTCLIVGFGAAGASLRRRRWGGRVTI